MTDKAKLPTMVQMTEDTAGNCWYSEFEPGSTVPVRSWVVSKKNGGPYMVEYDLKVISEF